MSGKWISCLGLMALGFGVCAPNISTAAHHEGEWVALFNGKDFTGWELPEGEHSWQVIDGVIDYEAKGGNLVTEKEYGDYELSLEWRFKRTAGDPYNAKVFNEDGMQKTDADGNPMTKPVANADSGIFVRGVPSSQVNLWCWPCGSGQLWSYHTSDDPEIRKGAIPSENADKPVGEWNSMQITMKGETIKVVLNGKKVIDTKMPGVPAKGPIVLQHHGGFNVFTQKWNSASALIQFKDIKIRELHEANDDEWQALLDEDFDGWKFHFENNVTENKGTFKIEDGVLYCNGVQKGYVYSDQSYDTFTFSADFAFERPEGLEDGSNYRGNSGVLIHCGEKNALGVWPRCIEVQGMHVQMGLILPIPRDLPCIKTEDSAVRKEVRKDVGEWNNLTIVVDGPDMVIKLNGEVISTVKECELTSGPIGIQSEGAATKWRNIKILER